MTEDRNYDSGSGNPNKDDTLYRLNELSNYKVADHSTDIRGWKVKSQDGKVIGQVKDLVVDKVAEKVRYIDLELEKEFIVDDEHADIHLLVPIGAARLDETEDHVVIDRIISNDELHSYPRSTGRIITREYEQSVVDYHNRPKIYTGMGDDTYTGTTSIPDQTSGSKDDPIIAYDHNDESTFYNQECFKEEKLYQSRQSR